MVIDPPPPIRNIAAKNIPKHWGWQPSHPRQHTINFPSRILQKDSQLDFEKIKSSVARENYQVFWSINFHQSSNEALGITMHLSPQIDGVHIPKSVRQMQYSGVIQHIKGYLAQMDHSPDGEDIQMTTSGIERDTDNGVDAGNESVIRGEKMHLRNLN